MKLFCLLILALIAFKSEAQKIDSIYFNLYTDSLKPGVHNYINVVAKLSNGSYRPLNSKQVSFWSDAGTWEGNDLILDSTFRQKYVFIKARLKENPGLADSVRIYMKTIKDTTALKTIDEIFPKKTRHK